MLSNNAIHLLPCISIFFISTLFSCYVNAYIQADNLKKKKNKWGVRIRMEYLRIENQSQAKEN